jgi:hypothetical protein
MVDDSHGTEDHPDPIRTAFVPDPTSNTASTEQRHRTVGLAEQRHIVRN